LDWDSGTTELIITDWSPDDGVIHVKLLAKGTILVHWPRQHPWGPSTQINRMDGPTKVPEGHLRLEIEMASGDVIVIEAVEFELAEEGQAS
jgi:hypothetical protein